MEAARHGAEEIVGAKGRRQADGAALNFPHDDLYTMLSSQDGKQSYRLEGNGYVFTARPVEAKFAMPPCDLTS